MIDFCPSRRKGLTLVHQVDAHRWHIDGDLADAAEAVVEVALDLQRERAVIQRLREFAEGDLARADEDDALHLGEARRTAPGWRRCCRWRRRRRVCAPTMRACVKAAVMPLSLKLPEGLRPSYCSRRLPGFMLELLGEQVGLLQDGAAFADGDDVFFAAVERHQFAEAPHAGEIEPALGSGALGRPAVLEKVRDSWGRAACDQS